MGLLPGENWTQFLPDLEAPTIPQGKRHNSRAAQRAMAKAARKAEVDGRISDMMAGKQVGICMSTTHPNPHEAHFLFLSITLTG